LNSDVQWPMPICQYLGKSCWRNDETSGISSVGSVFYQSVWFHHKTYIMLGEAKILDLGQILNMKDMPSAKELWRVDKIIPSALINSIYSTVSHPLQCSWKPKWSDCPRVHRKHYKQVGIKSSGCGVGWTRLVNRWCRDIHTINTVHICEYRHAVVENPTCGVF